MSPAHRRVQRQPLRVRSARRADLGALTALLGHLFAQEAEFKPAARTQRRGLSLLLERPALGRLLVLEQGGQVLGMVSLLASVSTALGAEVAWLEDLVVDPAHRGHGHGRRLLTAALAEARRRGYRRISLLTDADNAPAHALYRAHGFQASPMRPFRRLVQP